MARPGRPRKVTIDDFPMPPAPHQETGEEPNIETMAKRRALSDLIMGELEKDEIDTRAFARLAAKDIQLARQIYETVDDKVLKAAAGAHRDTLAILTSAGFEKKSRSGHLEEEEWAKLLGGTDGPKDDDQQDKEED